MNLLSHYYIVKNMPDAAAHYVFGTVLPDLSRNYLKKFKIYGLEDIPPTMLMDSKAIAKGVQMHIETDRVFHNAAFFKRHTDVFEDYLKETEFSEFKKHYYFFAHITFELMLDRLLVKHHPKVAEEFYSLLSNVTKEAISGYFKAENAESYTDGFYHYYLNFLEKQYLYRYATNDGLIYALNRVYSKVSGTALYDSDKQLLEESLDRYENYLIPHLESIMVEVREGLWK